MGCRGAVEVFRECEEIFVGSQRPNAHRIGIRALRGSPLQDWRVPLPDAESSPPAVGNDAAAIDDLLSLGDGSIALSGYQVCIFA